MFNPSQSTNTQAFIAVNPIAVMPPNFFNDLTGFAGSIAPLLAMVWFAFNLDARIKAIEEKRKANDEIFWLKIENLFNGLKTELTQIRDNHTETKHDIDCLEKENELRRNAQSDILKQLSGLGIDLYVVGETDRRNPRIKD